MSDSRYRTLRADTQKRRIKIMKKRLGALLLAASMAVSTVALGGCSSGKPREEGEQEGQIQGDTAADNLADGDSVGNLLVQKAIRGLLCQ